MRQTNLAFEPLFTQGTRESHSFVFRHVVVIVRFDRKAFLTYIAPVRKPPRVRL